jgi:sulfite reductase alpha subunit-like flavoprotein
MTTIATFQEILENYKEILEPFHNKINTNELADSIMSLMIHCLNNILYAYVSVYSINCFLIFTFGSMSIVIVYASQTGTAEEVATELQINIRKCGCSVVNISVQYLTLKMLQTFSEDVKIVFLISTTGDG